MRQYWQTLVVSGLLTLLTACGGDTNSPPETASTATTATPTAPATEPVATTADTTVAQEASPSISIAIPTATPEGQALYDKQCKICHDQGLLDAPKLRDSANWQARIAKIDDIDTFYQRAINGYNKMPAQVTDGVSANDVKLAVDYMVATTAQ